MDKPSPLKDTWMFCGGKAHHGLVDVGTSAMAGKESKLPS
jgi:hypothetical protein